jgi:hypothetical protein
MSDPTNDPYTGGDAAGDRSDQWQSDEPTSDAPTGDRNPADEDRPISDRLGRNPGNLGSDVTDLGDVTHPSPEPPEGQM